MFFLNLINFFGTTFGKWTIFGLFICAGLLFGWNLLRIHDSNEREAALVKQNVAQLEQSLKNQAIISEKLSNIWITQERIMQEMNDKNKELTVKLQKVEDYLNEPETVKQDRESSDILKNTVKGLQK